MWNYKEREQQIFRAHARDTIVRLVLELVTRFIEEKEATSEIIIISKKQVLQRYIQGNILS